MIPNGVIQFPKRDDDPSVPPEDKLNFYAKEGGAFVQDENDVVNNVGFIPPLIGSLGGTGVDADTLDAGNVLVSNGAGGYEASGYQAPLTFKVGVIPSNTTTTSTSFTDIHSNLHHTIDVITGNIMVGFFGFCTGVGGAARLRFGVAVDGTQINPQGQQVVNANASWISAFGFMNIFSVTPGTREIKPQWRMDSGEGQLYGNDRIQFWVMNI
jgi:hypothetical protein